MVVHSLFRDRVDAGQQLGQRVAHLLAADIAAGPEVAPVLVLGLPRGGVVVAAEVARAVRESAQAQGAEGAACHVALDVFVVRKIGAPWQPELALGAVADVDGRPEAVLNRDTIEALGVDDGYLQRETQAEHAEALRRLRAYRGAAPAPAIAGRTVVVVDDGIATGATVRAALQVIRRQHPARLILAVPVAPPESLDELRREVEDVVCLSSSAYFTSVGGAYDLFDQTSDQEVMALLQNPSAAGQPGNDRPARSFPSDQDYR